MTMRTSTRRDAGSPHALNRKVLDYAQQLGLRREREVRDLIQEQRAAVRMLEFPAAPLTPVAVRSSIPNSSASSSVSTSAAQLTATKGPRRLSLFVKLPRNELFAGAGLAFHE